MSEQEQRLGGPDVLFAVVHGNSIPELKMAALDKARDLYGPDAQLQIERVENVATSVAAEGSFRAYVYVRCLNLPEEDR